MPKSAGAPPTSAAFIWPAVAAAAVGELASEMAKEFATFAVGSEAKPGAPEPQWTTPNKVALELSTVRLRDFSTSVTGIPTLLCAPYALHGASVLDFASGHSVVDALMQAGRTRVFVTDWRTATAEMRFFSIDTYLSELNVLVDEIGETIDLVGSCQGGWLALAYAARFPAKVRRLVLAAAPIDIAAGESALSRLAKDTPLAAFKNMVEFGDGRVLGHRVLQFWGPASPDQIAIRRVLQIPDRDGSAASRRLEARFRDWYAWTVDLPGTYYLQVVERLFKENQLAAGRFIALGEKVDLANVRCPIYLLAARDDELVALAQLVATERLVGTPRQQIAKRVAAATSHLGLFMGRRVVAEHWPRVAQWLAQPSLQERPRAAVRTPRPARGRRASAPA